MPDQTTAVEIAAKAQMTMINDLLEKEGLPTCSWENTEPTIQALLREKMLPIVTALSDAGLLKEDQ